MPLIPHLLVLCFYLVQMGELEIQQHYDEFFEEVYVEMEKVTLLFFCCKALMLLLKSNLVSTKILTNISEIFF